MRPVAERAEGWKALLNESAERRIIDCHAHLTKRPVEGKGTKEELLAGMRKAGVATTLLMGESLANSLWYGTEELLNEVKDVPGLKVIAGIDMEGDIKEQAKRYEEAVRDGRIVGFKLYPGYQYVYPADPRLEPIYEVAAQLTVPVTIHTGDLYTEGAAQPPLLKYSHPLHVDEAAALHPGVTFIIAHLGNPWMLDAAEVVAKNPNVYADLSGLFMGRIEEPYRDLVVRQLQAAIASIGSVKRFLFGTDWPLIDQEEYVTFFESILPPEDHGLFFSGNATKLFRLS